jgi:Prokaryotic N-terminal methylation motif
MKLSNKQKGFSLIELLIVVAMRRSRFRTCFARGWRPMNRPPPVRCAPSTPRKLPTTRPTRGFHDLAKPWRIGGNLRDDCDLHSGLLD